MRLKVLLLGDDPTALVADGQLLKDRGMLVFTAFNIENVDALIAEIHPDVVFFDPHKPNKEMTDAYNDLVNGIRYTNLPVVFTLAEDDVYLITHRRTAAKDKRSFIADNMIDAVKKALIWEPAPVKKGHKTSYMHTIIPIPFSRA